MYLHHAVCAVGERWQRDENQNPVEDAAQVNFATKQQQRQHCCDGEGSDYNTTEVCEKIVHAFIHL